VAWRRAALSSAHFEAARRSFDGLQFTGDAMFTDTDTLCRMLAQRH